VLTMHSNYVHDASSEGLRKTSHALSGGSTTTTKPIEPPTAPAPSPEEADYTIADRVVLKELFRDINNGTTPKSDEAPSHQTQASLALLTALNEPQSAHFHPDILSSWDFDLQKTTDLSLVAQLLRAYVSWARTIVRHETDVVFLSHLLIISATILPSAAYLFTSFTYLHAVLHLVFTVWFAGSFTLLLHNHIHNNGVLVKGGWPGWVDWCFPYVLEPLMGHTWDSYYYHHVKHHHVEGNGPDDLSSTLRYQRDSLKDFLLYEARFLALLWAELPLYFASRGKWALAARSFVSEMLSLGFMVSMAKWQFRPALFVLILPFCVLRLGLMVGNWGQHALVDEVDPGSDYRSSITLIDVAVSLYHSSVPCLLLLHPLFSTSFAYPWYEIALTFTLNRRVIATPSTTATTPRTTSTPAATGAPTPPPSCPKNPAMQAKARSSSTT
jgi:hypothetical protein